MRLLALAGLALTAIPISAQQAPVTPTMLVDFGGLHDDPHAELLQVRRAVRLSNGYFVVVNGKPSDVRLFDARGRYLRSFGRSGSGPGEFRYAADIRSWSGDTVLTLSLGTQRWMLFDAGGGLIREYPVDDMHPSTLGMSLQRGHFVRNLLPGSRGCPFTLLDRERALAHEGLAEALTDAHGRLWMRDPSDTGVWRVRVPGSNTTQTLRLPSTFRIEEFMGDTVIGVYTDGDDADHVVQFTPVLPQGANARAPARCDPPARPALPIERTLRIHTRNALTTGEALHSDNGRYPRSMEEMSRLLVLTGGAELTVLASSEESWVISVADPVTGIRCIASAGRPGLPGWEPGSVACDLPNRAG